MNHETAVTIQIVAVCLMTVGMFWAMAWSEK
jgi:hypothetical protein